MPNTVDNVGLQRRLLRAEGKGTKALEREKAAVAEALGERGTTQAVAALFARTHGRFVGDFVLRNTEGLGKREAKAVIKELADEYAAVLQRSVTPAELLKLAEEEANYPIVQKAVDAREGNGHGRRR